jgi:prepilin-type N-terminal cleavage/methylation domain-containing protein
MKYRHQGGFTLIEVLVTLVVIAIGVSLIGLNVFGANQQLKLDNAMQSFVKRLQLAQEESVLMNRQMGFSVATEVGKPGAKIVWYSLALQDDGLWAWRPADADVFKPAQLDVLNVTEFIVDGLPVDTLEIREPRNPEVFNGTSISLAKGILPQVFVFASGELSSFMLRVALEDTLNEIQTHRVEGNLLGQIRWLKPGEDGSEFGD